MSSIKKREVVKGTIKTFDKALTSTQKTKSNLVDIKEKSENATQTNENNASEYAVNRLTGGAKRIYDNSGKIKQKGNDSVRQTKANFIKTKEKIKNIKTKLAEKKKIKDTAKGIKNSRKVAKKVVKKSMTTTQKAKMLIKNTAKATYHGLRFTVKATVSSVKAIIMGTKALITALMAGGWIALVIIIIICLIGMLCSSIFGIFFSGEKTSANSITMNDVIAECNLDFSNQLQVIQAQNPHDDYVLEGSMASWKDVILIYAVKQSNGVNEQEVMTIDNQKKMVFKQIFWEMNSISSEVITENVIEQGVNTLEKPKEVQKRVLHIRITSKTAEEMKTQYQFTPQQNMQFNELLSDDYDSLWNALIYGSGTGDYINWRQSGASWSNIRIGNTDSTISDIGCLVTSVAILIEKSGVPTSIDPFNPGTFVEALNKNNGFDANGNLQYGAISKVVPGFKYVGKENLRNKTREEKFSLIKKYFDMGYFLTVEVKGATEGNQHWVAVMGINGSDIVMVDPGSNHTSMWNAYEVSKTSQFNYFKAN